MTQSRAQECARARRSNTHAPPLPPPLSLKLWPNSIGARFDIAGTNQRRPQQRVSHALEPRKHLNWTARARARWCEGCSLACASRQISYLLTFASCAACVTMRPQCSVTQTTQQSNAHAHSVRCAGQRCRCRAGLCELFAIKRHSTLGSFVVVVVVVVVVA